jgi:hypothetical protein
MISRWAATRLGGSRCHPLRNVHAWLVGVANRGGAGVIQPSVPFGRPVEQRTETRRNGGPKAQRNRSYQGGISTNSASRSLLLKIVFGGDSALNELRFVDRKISKAQH